MKIVMGSLVSVFNCTAVLSNRINREFTSLCMIVFQICVCVCIMCFELYWGISSCILVGSCHFFYWFVMHVLFGKKELSEVIL